MQEDPEFKTNLGYPARHCLKERNYLMGKLKHRGDVCVWGGG